MFIKYVITVTSFIALYNVISLVDHFSLPDLIGLVSATICLATCWDLTDNQKINSRENRKSEVIKFE